MSLPTRRGRRAQTMISNGFGASVGLEAGYTQVGCGLRLPARRAFGLRRDDLRILVGCGAAGAIAAAFDAPLTGAFYAFELVIGTYTIAHARPGRRRSAVAGSLVARRAGRRRPLGSRCAAPAPLAATRSSACCSACSAALLGIALMRGVSWSRRRFRAPLPGPRCARPSAGCAVGGLALLTPGGALGRPRRAHHDLSHRASRSAAR